MTPHEYVREQQALASLRQLAKDWPSSLWLWVANGELFVMAKEKGQRAVKDNECVDDFYVVEKILIEVDGGDW